MHIDTNMTNFIIQDHSPADMVTPDYFFEQAEQTSQQHPSSLSLVAPQFAIPKNGDLWPMPSTKEQV